LPLSSITPAAVRVWHGDLGKKANHPGARLWIAAHHPGPPSPTVSCRPILAPSGVPERRSAPARYARLTLEELARLVAAMPERYKLMTLLAAWCALRFG